MNSRESCSRAEVSTPVGARLSEFTTEALVAELRVREGVKWTDVAPYKEQSVSCTGPAIILVVVD